MLLGLHHITAFAGEPRRNIEFYSRFLGLKLVKRTVNFDDPATYHFYFGDAEGSPGTLLTFFSWQTAPAGRKGSGQGASVSFTIPENSIEHWRHRAQQSGVLLVEARSRMDETFLTVIDPEGLEVELFATAPPNNEPSIAGLHSATIAEADPGRTGEFLRDVLGFLFVAQKDGCARFDLSGTPIDIVPSAESRRGRVSRGMVHHVAFRVADERTQMQWRDRLVAAGVRVTRVIDRQYFRSIYFREPGGMLFEIATDGPGFLVDEALEVLGTTLQLPSWLEPVREGIERRLPRLEPS